MSIMAAALRADRGFDRIVKFIGARDGDGFQLEAELVARQLQFAKHHRAALTGLMPQHRHARCARQRLLEQLQSFTAQIRTHAAQTGNIGAGPGEVGDDAGLHGNPRPE